MYYIICLQLIPFLNSYTYLDNNSVLKYWWINYYVTKAIGVTLKRGTITPLNDILPSLAQRMLDHSPSVRSTLTEILADWIMNLLDRYILVSLALITLLHEGNNHIFLLCLDILTFTRSFLCYLQVKQMNYQKLLN